MESLSSTAYLKRPSFLELVWAYFDSDKPFHTNSKTSAKNGGSAADEENAQHREKKKKKMFDSHFRLTILFERIKKRKWVEFKRPFRFVDSFRVHFFFINSQFLASFFFVSQCLFWREEAERSLSKVKGPAAKAGSILYDIFASTVEQASPRLPCPA